VAEHYDVVVVGGGSSGGVVAARLSEDAARSVLLLEAGPDFPDEATRPPAFFTGGALNGERGAGSGPPTPDTDWGYFSEPVAGGERLHLPRGKLVGGSSMTNGCVAVRGRPEDFGRWLDAGAEGWGWDDVLPWYEAVEREIPIKRYPREVWLPVQGLLVDACLEIGFRYVDDLNEPDAWDGVAGPWPRNRRNEIRQGTLVTYIREARPRPNLTIVDRALVDRVVLEGDRTVGVAYVDREGRLQQVGADRVVLSAGAYGSAPILLRSGIGPAGELRALGIEPVAELPVGRRLLEHPGCNFPFALDREHARMGWPSLAAVSRGADYWGIPRAADEEAGLAQISFCLGLVDGPDGSIRLASREPDVPPVIDHRFVDVIEHGFETVYDDFRRLLATKAFREAGVRDSREGMPLPERVRNGIFTGTHPAGGCSIGSVVDPDLNVYGIDGLTVADASVFPLHVTNNPNLTCHVVGEVAAARIGGSRPG
jgi:choline dehydrogenase